MYQSLYGRKHDVLPESYVDVPFEYFKLFDIENFKEYSGFSFPESSDYNGKNIKYVTNKSVKYQGIDQIIFPDLLLPSRPQALTSKDSYQIVRKHIKDNIDPKWARITFDYDFCFTVKKRVPLAKPYSVRSEVKTAKGRSYRNPKFNTREIKETEIPIFEMTHAGENYKGYTPIPAFKGDNEEDLKNNIEMYLAELMENINAPMFPCDCCGGTGYINKKS